MAEPWDGDLLQTLVKRGQTSDDEELRETEEFDSANRSREDLGLTGRR